eukprot:m.419825 g.419825  ORF g.419825 m.419825 type:complete len:303 (+) comp21309_c1_seq1:214-1122(+)
MSTIKRVCSILEDACGVGEETLAEFVVEIATKNGSSVGQFSASLAAVGAEFPEDVVSRIWKVVQSSAASKTEKVEVTQAPSPTKAPLAGRSIPAAAQATSTETADPKDALMKDFLSNELGESEGNAEVKKDASNESALPSDFFDKDVKPAHSEAGTQAGNKKRKGDVAESIPEGFFDDPVRDAKIRKVPVKNEAEEEWQRFEKDMATEAKISEDLLETDFNQMSAHRIVEDELDQKRYEAKARSLKLHGQALLKKRAETEPAAASEGGGEDAESADEEANGAEDDDDSESDDEELGWRSKGI